CDMTNYHGYEPTGETARASPLGLASVIALTGVLVIRPEELLPPIEGLQLYYALIVCALLYHAPAIARGFGGSARDPLLILVLGLLAAVVASHAANLRPGLAVEEGQSFAKVVAYYVVLTAALTSLPALRAFLTALVVFIAAQPTLALLQYQRYIDVEALRPWLQVELDPEG